MTVVLDGETGKLSSALNKGQSLIGSFAAKASTAAGAVKGTVGGMTSMISGKMLAFGAALGIGAIGLHSILGEIEDVSKIKDASDRLDIAAGSLITFGEMAKMAGGDQESMTAGMQAMSIGSKREAKKQ